MQNEKQNERQPKVYGYSRVSTKKNKKKQTHTRQLEELNKHSCDEIFKEEISGGKSYSKRPQLLELLNSLEEGDKLISTQLDRICRDMKDLQDIVAILKEKKATIHILGAGIYIDTRYPNAAAEMQLNMLGAFAQFERAMISERVLEGLAGAAAEGRYGGRPTEFTRNSISVKLMAEKKKAGMAITKIAKESEISRTTLYTIMKNFPDLFDTDLAEE